MFDPVLKEKITPFLDAAGQRLAALGVTANMATAAGLILGLVSAGLIVLEWYGTAAVILILSRIFDGLDGAIARATTSTRYGGFLDITYDFFFYGAIPLAFGFASPDQNMTAAAVLLAAFYANGASFLAFAIAAAKLDIETEAYGKKAFFFSRGIAEAFETYAFFVAFCLFPSWFPWLAYAFTALCALSVIDRLFLAKSLFGDR